MICIRDFSTFLMHKERKNTYIHTLDEGEGELKKYPTKQPADRSSEIRGLCKMKFPPAKHSKYDISFVFHVALFPLKCPDLI